ncbi:MAG TPA: GreA/GreB family elongation factor [Agitococcus sp.]|nr:GreA/GreB family elongation factor [Pseudomonadales bacterium]MCB1674162.1 GreA/GreB family elongation factor [Pseudomonadales bacterium]MCP5177386.1 GreA/GreB family elongation factor [Moraxellaceae bacterium]HQV22265.1 GreA/GreB family elongation factor [Agitococcus sp.]
MLSSSNSLINNSVFVSEQGFAALQEQLNTTQARYLDVCEQRRIAHELSGDGWHDNPEFNRQQQMEAFLNGEVKRLLQNLDKAKIFTIQEHARPTDKVWLGSVVEVEVTDCVTGNSHNETWEIVGHGESNAELKKLAYDVPLARAILTLQADDCSDEFMLRGQEVFITVLNLYSSRQQAGLGE